MKPLATQVALDPLNNTSSRTRFWHTTFSTEIIIYNNLKCDISNEEDIYIYIYVTGNLCNQALHAVTELFMHFVKGHYV